MHGPLAQAAGPLHRLPLYDLTLRLADNGRDFTVREAVTVTNTERAPLRDLVLRVYGNAPRPPANAAQGGAQAARPSGPPVRFVRGSCEGGACTVAAESPSVVVVRLAQPLAPGAAEVLGADLAYMGTRFIATEESQAQHEYKQMLVDCGVDDLVYSDRFSGVHANFLKPSIVRHGIDIATLPPKAPDVSSLAGTDAKAWKDIWSAGQGLATIHDIPPVAELVARLRAEYDRACAAGVSPALRR